MFFALSKLLYFLLQPLNWIVILLLVALFLRKGKWKRRCLRTGVAILLVFSNPLLFNQLVGWWETETIEKDELSEQHDVAIVLGGYAGFRFPEDIESYDFSKSVDRLTAAVELYKSGKVDYILLTGGSGQLLKEVPSESVGMHRFLRKLEVPDTAIWVEPDSRNTRENALNSKALLDEKMPNARSILITSAIHMPRASDCFEKVDLNPTLLSVDHISRPQEWLLNDFLMSSAPALREWERLLKEWVGFVVYKLQGYA